jgi:hypothetical protein
MAPALLRCYPSEVGGQEGAHRLRVLVAFEDDYRAYREVIAAGIGVLRPRAEVRTANPDALEEELERFKPQVVICGRPESASPSDVPAWIELSLDPLRPGRIRVGDRRWESTNPTLDVLLGVIDEVEVALS